MTEVKTIRLAPKRCCILKGTLKTLRGKAESMSQGSKYTDRHRAQYILERGVWKARCRLCAWETEDPTHRQAMVLFRSHIREARADAAHIQVVEHDEVIDTVDVVDLRDDASTTIPQPL